MAVLFSYCNSYLSDAFLLQYQDGCLKAPWGDWFIFGWVMSVSVGSADVLQAVRIAGLGPMWEL